jgi:hypothetical protein
MTQRKLSRIIAAGILAAVLALPAPAHAAFNRTRGPVNLWEWMVRVWERGISAVVPERGVDQKEGLGIDPNGGKPAGQGGSGSGTVPDNGTATPQDGLGSSIDSNS